MPSPRNSRFIENFDDSSESPSPESNSTAPFPDCTSGFSLPTQIIQQFSAMGLRNTSPRGSDHNNGTTSQPQSPVQVQTPTQPQAPATTQHSKSEAADVRSMKSSTMLVDDLILSLELGTDKTSNQPSSGATPPQIQINSESQPARDGEDLPEELNDGIDGQSEPESETSASSSSSKQDSEQNEPINPVRLKSIDFIKTAVDDFFEDIQTERGIHPDTLTENFNALHQHLQHFRKVRDATARKFQRCYSSHARTKTSPADCDDCHMYLAQIEHGYTGACANIMSMMTELRKGIWTSVMKANFHREIEESVNTLARGGLFVHDVNLQRLEETKGMLQSLEDDAEAAKGWPQVSLNDAPPEDGQASKKTKEDEDTGNDGTKSSQVKSKKGKSKEQKKKKKGKR
ncbi:hypothetical protein KCU62_g3859, partial [Aureobasidium sp. EXF-3399]